MGKHKSHESLKKQAKEAARWEATHAKPPAPKPSTYCTRCGAGLSSAADQDQHNAEAHIRRGGPSRS